MRKATPSPAELGSQELADWLSDEELNNLIEEESGAAEASAVGAGK